MSENLSNLGFSMLGTWPDPLRANLEEALFTYIGEENLRLWLNNKPVTIRFGGGNKMVAGIYHGLTSGSRITLFANQTTNPVINILHEFGHLVDNLWGDFFTNHLEKTPFLRNQAFFGGWNGRAYLGLRRDIIRSEVLKARGIAGGDAWQQRGGVPHWEDWADIFSNATLGNINPENEVGKQILDFVALMNKHVKGPDLMTAETPNLPA